MTSVALNIIFCNLFLHHFSIFLPPVGQAPSNPQSAIKGDRNVMEERRSNMPLLAKTSLGRPLDRFEVSLMPYYYAPARLQIV